jgi:hypothetical protein
VKRYSMDAGFNGGGGLVMNVNEAPDGKWVKYEDVKPLFDVLEVPDMENAIARAGSLAAGFEAVKLERDQSYAAANIVTGALWRLLGCPAGEMDDVRFIRMLEERLK